MYISPTHFLLVILYFVLSSISSFHFFFLSFVLSCQLLLPPFLLLFLFSPFVLLLHISFLTFLSFFSSSYLSAFLSFHTFFLAFILSFSSPFPSPSRYSSYYHLHCLILAIVNPILHPILLPFVFSCHSLHWSSSLPSVCLALFHSSLLAVFVSSHVIITFICIYLKCPIIVVVTFTIAFMLTFTNAQSISCIEMLFEHTMELILDIAVSN